ncbi:MAG TPA: hypothetical protein VJV78_20975 [Polyangiales bacterium]|nr:hypothetical protein [Polyangiales bacterium]
MRQISAPQVWPSIIKGAQREAPRIVAKDVSPYVPFLAELGDGGFLALETSGLAAVPGRLVRRDAALEPVAVLPNLQTAAALSPNRRWLLAGGPCLEAEVAAAVLVDVAEWRAVRTLPLRPPFVWLDDQRFIAQTPRFRYETQNGCMVPTTRLVDPALVATAAHLLDIVPGLVLVDRTTLEARLLLPSESFRGEDACALSADGSILFSTTNFARTSAVRIEDGSLVFQHPASRLIFEGTVHALACNAARSEIVTVGTGADPVRVLDATTGAYKLRWDPLQPCVRAGLRAPKLLGALAVHADGRVAIGSNIGVLLEVAPDGQRITACKAATRAIQALAYARHSGALIIGGNERNLRVLPSDGAN